MIYFSSDQHHGHKNVILYSQRPFSSVEEMNEALIENHNKVVKPGDTCYHLGDFAFQSEKDIKSTLRRLNGVNHFVIGNHDRTIVDKPRNFIGPQLFESIQHYKEIKPGGQKIVLFHFGCRVWHESHRNSILLFGHSHGSLPCYGKSMDVGVDAKFITPEYRPISLDEVLDFMKDRPGEIVDHHGK